MSESKSEKEYKKEKPEVSYGEPVGVVAAQSLGEPATQMVLKSFHTAGVSSVVTTTGLPRVIEIIDARKRVKLPVMRIRAEKSIAKDYEKVKQLKQKIEEIKLKSLLTNYEEDIKSGTIKFNFSGSRSPKTLAFTKCLTVSSYAALASTDALSPAIPCLPMLLIMPV